MSLDCERVRQAGLVQKAAVLIAVSADESGKRCVLGVSVALSEHEVHWRTFLQSLVARGLRGVRLVISDAHEELKAARLAVFGGVPRQEMKPQNMKPQVAADIRAIYNAQDKAEADTLLKRTAQKYVQTAPKLAAWLEESLPEGLTVLSFPEAHRRLLRTTNGVERVTLIKPQSRDQASHAGGEYLSERSVVPAPSECVIDGDQR